METEQLLTLILENREQIAQVKLEIINQAKETRLWILGGVLAGFPLAILVHRHLHPIEHFIGERGKEIDKMLNEAKKLIF